MEAPQPPTGPQCSRSRMIGYSVGECANSLLMNSISGFAMLYYTEALGLKHSLAGIAMAIAVLWDAVTDPVMGHITDNTRSRWGRRHPYILIGGVLVVLVYIFLWYVPEFARSDMTILFWYLVVINLLHRTAITIFVVPYTALGFEICSDYDGRVTLQGIRSAINMLSNLLGPALAWTLFFADNERSRATTLMGNYVDMGLSFAAVSMVSILLVLYTTRGYIADSRLTVTVQHGVRGFIRDMKEIGTDPNPRYVFIFTVVVTVGIAVMASLQMYLYEHFMRFGGYEKTVVHGGSMVGFGIGSLLSGLLARRLDKKGAVLFAALLSIGSNFVLAALFLPGWLTPGQTLAVGGLTVPLAFLVFGLFHGLYWLGNGVIFPTALSMMADVAEINQIHTGVNKDGAYSAVFSFSQKVAFSIALLLSGYILTLIGFRTGVGVDQDPAVISRLCAATLLIGPLISLASLILIRFYPVNRHMLADLRAAGARPAKASSA
jgi:GPH family glycoside/pentoside/hexuronide:cation symporter